MLQGKGDREWEKDVGAGAKKKKGRESGGNSFLGKPHDYVECGGNLRGQVLIGTAWVLWGGEIKRGGGG